MTVIYAIVGIPLMLITLNDLGKFLFKMINNLVKISSRRLTSLGVLWKNNGKKTIELDKLERGDATENSKLSYQVSVEGTTDDAQTVNTTDVIFEENRKEQPRIPVPVALTITIGWIFACAGLFKIWEDNWTYAESCYFMFISLSTIGLGDLAVKRRDLMVMCFIFVIIGLSLVSMCISVIQSALEDLYMSILMKMLIEYQNKLNQGDSHTGASMGMMKIWGGNKTAKYFMPLLSKEKRKTALAKVQDVAEANGMEVPKIFSEIDEKSGLPNAFGLTEDKTALEEEIKNVEREIEFEPRMSFASLLASTNVVMYDSAAQTDNPYSEEKCEQTAEVITVDANVGNEMDSSEYECTAVQCERASVREESTQVLTPTTRNSDTMTDAVAYTESTVQTECLPTKEQELQTHLADYLEQDVQTDEVIFRFPTTDTGMQTDKIPRTTAHLRERRSFHTRNAPERRQSASASVNVWKDPLLEERGESDTDESIESLDWDPRDGLHAEKQRSVRDLKKFWDVKGTSSSSSKRKTQ